MEKLKGFIKNNIALKLVSICIAFILWLIAYNVSNPEVTDSVSAGLNVRHESELTGINKTYSIDISTVRVSYRVRSQDRKKVSSSNFDVYIDLSDYSLTGAVPIYYEMDSSLLGLVSSVSINPIVAHVEIEDMVAKAFAIDLDITGTQEDGKELGSVSLSSETVALYGPASDIGRIARVTTEIDIDGASETVSGEAELTFHDSNDSVIVPGSKTEVMDTIIYTVPVYSTKRLSVSASYTGVPAVGYTLNSFTVEPSYLTVYGPDEILEQYSVITIPAEQINISGATSNIAQLIDGSIYIPEGLYLSGSGDISIVASIGRSSMPASMPAGGAPAAGGSEAAETTAAQTAESTETVAEESTEAESGDEIETIPSSDEEGVITGVAPRENADDVSLPEEGASAAAE